MQNTWKRRVTSPRVKTVLPAFLSPLLLLACNFGTTMPTPFVVGEGPASVGKKQTRLDVGAGGGGGSCCGWSGPGLGGHVRVRHGIADRHELGVSAMALGIEAETERGRYPANFWLSAKLDYKWQLNPYAALLLGAGGGLSPFSPFIGGDVGVVVGRPGWKKFVPYGAIRLSGSLPVGTEDRLLEDEDSGETGPIVPNVTLMGAVGLKINFKRWIAWVIEVGGGGIFPIGGPGNDVHGGALYGYTGLSFRLGGPK